MNLDEERRLVQNWRGRRLLACRAVDTLQDVIKNLGSDDGSQAPPERGFPVFSETMRNELENSAITLLRMILALNDGRVSSTLLRRF